MKRKIIGLFIFMFFIFGVVYLEGGVVQYFLDLTPMLFVLGITGGLLVMYSEKGMDKNKILKKAKQYFVFSGYFSVLISIIMISGTRQVKELLSFESTIRTASVVLLNVFYGYAFSYITDTFIKE